MSGNNSDDDEYLAKSGVGVERNENDGGGTIPKVAFKTTKSHRTHFDSPIGIILPFNFAKIE